MDAVLAADFTQLRFDEHTGRMALRHHLRRRRDVRVVGQLRPVEHHRPDAERDRLGHQRTVLGMVEMDGHRDRRRARDRQRGKGDRRQGTVVADGVLTDLQDHRRTGGFGAGDEGFGVLELDHVERAPHPGVR